MCNLGLATEAPKPVAGPAARPEPLTASSQGGLHCSALSTVFPVPASSWGTLTSVILPRPSQRYTTPISERRGGTEGPSHQCKGHTASQEQSQNVWLVRLSCIQYCMSQWEDGAWAAPQPIWRGSGGRGFLEEVKYKEVSGSWLDVLGKGIATGLVVQAGTVRVL